MRKEIYFTDVPAKETIAFSPTDRNQSVLLHLLLHLLLFLKREEREREEIKEMKMKEMEASATALISTSINLNDSSRSLVIRNSTEIER